VRSARTAQGWHAATAAVAAFALGTQLVLVVLADSVPALVYPVAWLSYTLVVGAASGWYPYPFVDVPEQGAAAVAVACVGVTALILAVSALVWLGDRRMAPAPRPRQVAER
jgi:hypothetical protein